MSRQRATTKTGKLRLISIARFSTTAPFEVGRPLTHHNEVEDFVRQAADTLLKRIADPDLVPIPLENVAVIMKVTGVFAHQKRGSFGN